MTKGAGNYQNTAYQFHPIKPKTPHPLDETTSHSTRLQKTAAKSLVNPSLPLEGEGTVAHPAYFDVVKHTLLLDASCILRLTECHVTLAPFTTLAETASSLMAVTCAAQNSVPIFMLAPSCLRGRKNAGFLFRREGWGLWGAYEVHTVDMA